MELILFVGLPGSGKSTYYRAHFAATHVHVSKDLMKNASNRDMRQQKMIEDALKGGRPVVVDNTNVTPAIRAPLVQLGHRLGVRVVACFFETTVKDAVARNRQREGKERVPDAAIYIMARKLVPPSFDEDFDEVRVIAPLPSPQ